MTKGNADAPGQPSEVAAGTLSTLSSSLERTAEAARRGGMIVRDRCRDSAKVLERGEGVLRDAGVPGAALALTSRLRRHRVAVAGAAGAVAAGLVLAGLVRRLRR